MLGIPIGLVTMLPKVAAMAWSRFDVITGPFDVRGGVKEELPTK